MTQFEDLKRKLMQNPRPEQPPEHIILEVRKEFVNRVRANPTHSMDPVLAYHLGLHQTETGRELKPTDQKK